MRHARQTSLGKRPAVSRLMLTTALLLCVLSGALPAEAVLNPHDAMPCCRGTKGGAGECHGTSCPMHLRARTKSAKRAQRDPVCGAGRLLRAAALKTLLAPQTPSAHGHGGQRTPPETFAGFASLNRPCPSECCGAAAVAFAGLRRQRNAAALNENLRPRPPDSESQRHAPNGVTRTASALRRRHPSRAPPHSKDTRTA